MKSFLAFAPSALLLYTACAHGAVISVGGTDFGGTEINGIAEGWSMSFSDNVSIAAHLTNGNGPVPATGNTAYLTSGSLPTIANVVATANFTLPGNYNGMFTLFSGVSLSAGSYWLIFSSPGPPNSYASWEASYPATLTTAPGVQFLGYAYSFDANMTFQTPVNNAFAYQLTVTDVPEPSSLSLYLVGLGAFGYRRLLFLKHRTQIGRQRPSRILTIRYCPKMF